MWNDWEIKIVRKVLSWMVDRSFFNEIFTANSRNWVHPKLLLCMCHRFDTSHNAIIYWIKKIKIKIRSTTIYRVIISYIYGTTIPNETIIIILLSAILILVLELFEKRLCNALKFNKNWRFYRFLKFWSRTVSKSVLFYDRFK